MPFPVNLIKAKRCHMNVRTTRYKLNSMCKNSQPYLNNVLLYDLMSRNFELRNSSCLDYFHHWGLHRLHDKTGA